MEYKSLVKTGQCENECDQSFFKIDKAAITRKAIPAHQVLLVKNQTMKATIAAGMRISTSRIKKIMIKPIMMSITSPIKSGTGKGRLKTATRLYICS